MHSEATAIITATSSMDAKGLALHCSVTGRSTCPAPAASSRWWTGSSACLSGLLHSGSDAEHGHKYTAITASVRVVSITSRPIIFVGDVSSSNQARVTSRRGHMEAGHMCAGTCGRLILGDHAVRASFATPPRVSACFTASSESSAGRVSRVIDQLGGPNPSLIPPPPLAHRNPHSPLLFFKRDRARRCAGKCRFCWSGPSHTPTGDTAVLLSEPTAPDVLPRPHRHLPWRWAW